MKALSILFLTALTLCACNDHNADHKTSKDSIGHSEHGNGEVATQSPQPLTMSGSMEKNMQQMMAVPATGNADIDFANIMKVHHQGAVEMAQLLLDKGTDEELKNFSGLVIREQQKEIGQFEQFVKGHAAQPGSKDLFHEKTMGHMNHNMDVDTTRSIDIQFAQLMIVHHQGAVDMVGDYLNGGAKDPALIEMAKKIRSDQQKEIRLLGNWLKKHQ